MFVLSLWVCKDIQCIRFLQTTLFFQLIWGENLGGKCDNMLMAHAHIMVKCGHVYDDAWQPQSNSLLKLNQCFGHSQTLNEYYVWIYLISCWEHFVNMRYDAIYDTQVWNNSTLFKSSKYVPNNMMSIKCLQNLHQFTIKTNSTGKLFIYEIHYFLCLKKPQSKIKHAARGWLCSSFR